MLLACRDPSVFDAKLRARTLQAPALPRMLWLLVLACLLLANDALAKRWLHVFAPTAVCRRVGRAPLLAVPALACLLRTPLIKMTLWC